MIMNSFAAALTAALTGTVGILPAANPREFEIWPT